MSLGPVTVIPSSQATPPNSGSMAANITSQASIVPFAGMISYEVVWNGTTPVGSVSVQGSNDFSLNAEGNVLNPGNWTVMTVNFNGSAVTTIPITGNTGEGLIDIVTTAVYAIRLIYTSTSGTGSLTVTAFGRGN